jgi:hypothetical protein
LLSLSLLFARLRALQSSALGERNERSSSEEDYYFFFFLHVRERKDVSKKKIVDAKNTPENSSF